MFTAPVRVCFVCSGNICRSPTAEVVLKRIAADAGRSGLVRTDSAGTGDWHAGNDIDVRARRTMVHAGHEVPVHRAKQFSAADFACRDVVVALDSGHRNALWCLAIETVDAAAARDKLVLLRSFDPLLAAGEAPDVPDPYYGGPRGFIEVLAQIERSCAALFDAIDAAVTAGADRLQQTCNPPL